MNPGAKNVSYQSPHHLIITFTNGEVKKFDLRPYLDYPVYSDLKNESYCSKATVQNGTVIWSEEIDIDPDRLYLESK
ncbi:MAG TPA: DUF2442 domain-containing protein [Chitinophagaceae bacterium]|nr:DUF2442 domain-containing protein [Chitinophagaceae bacterium]